MTFSHPILLPLVAIPLVWMLYGWRRAPRRVPLVLKGLSFAAILFALSEPAATLPEQKIAEVVLVDISASVTSDDLTRASSMARSIERAKGRNWVKIIPFDSSAHPSGTLERNSGIYIQQIASSSTGTNLELALTSSMATIPNGYLPRFLLISDGNQNEGSVVRAIAQLQRLHIPVDTVALGGRAASNIRVQSVSLPHEAFSGEQIPVQLSVVSPVSTRASVDLYAEGKLLGRHDVDLQAGLNQLDLNARIESAGVISVAGRVQSPGAGEAKFEQALQLRRARLLYVSEDPPGTDANLLAALNQAKFEVMRSPAEIDKDLESFDLLVLNNLDLGAFSSARKSRIESYVKAGGGLMLIGGERQIYKEDKQLDALDRALPAKLAPPDTPKGTCVALIIDKSSSMEGRKIELARLSAIGVVDHLRPVDTIGVLIFDNSFQWAVPMRRAEDKPLIKRLISGITPDGGTQIAPALAEAYRRVLPAIATFKHIVLLTDGISEEGDSIDLAKEAANHDVTISTVGLGQDVNRAYLEKIASTSSGRSYFLNEPMGLEQILLKDVENYSGSTAVEKPLTPIVAGKPEVLEGVGMESAPPLRGYSRFIGKPGAETLLSIDAAKKDPLYVRWQYGLGRAAVFASDAKSRWAEQWMTWPGFDKFWINITRDLLMHSNRSEATAQFDAANGEMLVRYNIPAQAAEPVLVPPVYVLGPGGFHQPLELRKTASHLYEGRLHIGSRAGLFRILPANESKLFPEIGFDHQPPELQDTGANEELLRQLSSFTGGRFDPKLSGIFDSAGRSTLVQWQLWPLCLVLAIGLTIAELIARKWAGLAGRFRRP